MARLSGTVLKWTIRGFGFIKPEGSGDEELFCHFSEITDGRGLEEGSTIEFEIGYDEIKGKNRAVNVTGGIDEISTHIDPKPRNQNVASRRRRTCRSVEHR